ncbi:MAG TPA: sigma-70 family RNA polymerase sigma factor [Roseiflexaceae bacterium]|nr:sigma-70 family RNA polymerase sigma factor [Roseiflexaceae bacterium]
MSDELELLARARQYDPDTLGRIHDAYYGPIYRYIVFRVGDRETAEDLTSDVFERFLRALRTRTAPQGTLGGWLFRVAANVVSDHHRRRYRAPQTGLDERIESRDAGPEGAVEERMAREDLRRALAGLTEEQQHVIALRFGQELPIQDVARVLGKTEGAVKQLQARAIAALARKIVPGTSSQ